MDVKDFRIDNLAQDQNRNLLIVDALTKYDVIFTVVDRSKFPLPKGWKAEPIPLTEEWLLKFGFDSKTLIFRNGNFTMTWGNGGDYIDFQTIAGSYMIHVAHVHQLQNLYFALTGEELEIKV